MLFIKKKDDCVDSSFHSSLWINYQHTKRRIAESNEKNNTRLLFHGTKTDPAKILGDGLGGNASGFDPLLSGEGRYGRGSYFAARASYPVLIYPKQRNQDGTSSFIMAEVELGEVEDYGDKCADGIRRPGSRSPGKLFDSVRGTEECLGVSCGGVMEDGEQFVIFEKSQAYPHFHVTIELRDWQNTIRPGNQVAIYFTVEKRFLTMWEDGYTIGANPAQHSVVDLDSGFQWERFTVVDAGNGQVAFHSPSHNRFLRLNNNGKLDGNGGEKGAHELPEWWDSERFTVVDAGFGKVAIHCAAHNRFIRCCYGSIDSLGGERDVDQLPPESSWGCERAVIIPHPF